MWRRLVKAGRSHPSSAAQIRAPAGAPRQVSTFLVSSYARVPARQQALLGNRRGAATQLGGFLERAGAVWGEVEDAQEVHSSPCNGGTAWSWGVHISPERLTALRQGEPIESAPFMLGEGLGRARFQFFPKGDGSCEADGMCSLWLHCDQGLGPLSLRLGSTEHPGGASAFCKLQDVLHDGKVDVSLQLQSSGAPAATAATPVKQSLQLQGLQLAEWKIFQMAELRERGEFVTSMPFRFHHVLLGDMYMELMFLESGLCTVFFRCRVPTMKLKVGLSIGSNFSKSFVALGKNSPKDDMKTSSCLQVNLDAPGVVGPDGELTVRCALEEVVSLPSALQDMIPRLDERALWPKRL